MIGALLVVALVAGLTALDSVHAFQWLLSRPIVIGTLCGLILGETASGMLAGACIELLWLSVLPIANYIPPDSHVAAACAAVAAAIWQKGTGLAAPAPVLVAVLACVPIGILSKLGDLRLRRVLATRVEELVKRDPPYPIVGLTASVFLYTFFKAAAAVVVVAVVSIVVKSGVDALLAPPLVQRGCVFSYSMLPGLGMVQLARCLGAKGRERYIGLGAVVAILVFFALVIPR